MSEEMQVRISDQVRMRLDKGLTQSQVAQETGISEGALSKYLAGTYGADTNKLEAKLQKWLDMADRRSALALAAPDWQETPSAQRMRGIIEAAHLTLDIGLIAGWPGMGKTMTARQYQATHPRVYMATMSPDTTTVPAALEEVALALDLTVKPSQGGNHMRRAIVRALTGKGALLILDEVQHLQHKTLEVMRAIYDQAGIGLVLMGNGTLLDLVGGAGAVSSNDIKRPLAQLNSRSGFRVTVSHPSREDVAVICAAWGVTDKKSVDLLAKAAGRPGALRDVTKVLKSAKLAAIGLGESITHRLVLAAFDERMNG